MAERHTWRVAEVVAETADTCSFLLDLVGSEGAPVRYRAGQFLTVRVPSDRTGHVARSYSFSSAPATGEQPRITVRRTPGGYASNWLCDSLKAGDEVTSLAPGGVFTPSSYDADLLLIGGGSGITPVLSIAKEALASGTGTVVLVAANRGESTVIFGEELRALQRSYPDRCVVVHWLESVQGVPDERLGSLLQPYWDREVWVCGPAPLMDLVTDLAIGAGVPPTRVHTERFVSLTSDPFAVAAVPVAAPDEPAVLVELTLDGVRYDLSWRPGATLLDVALEAGLEAPYSCREGACSACACVITSGEVAMDRNEVLSDDDLAEGVVLSCQSRPRSAQVSATFDA